MVIDNGTRATSHANHELTDEFRATRQPLPPDAKIGQTAPDQLPLPDGPISPIRPALSGELLPIEAGHLNLSDSVQTLSRRFTLGWSHCVELLIRRKKKLDQATHNKIVSFTWAGNAELRQAQA